MARGKGARLLRILLVVAVVALAVVLWKGLSVGPEPQIEILSDHDLLGPENSLTVIAREPRLGLGKVEVAFVQGSRELPLTAWQSEGRRGPLPWDRIPAPETSIALTVGRESIPSLEEGPATIRVTADRASGFLRWPGPVVVERAYTVRLTPPSLAVLSTTHYVAQGGSEVVVYQVGETATSSGVRVGDWFFPGYPLPGGGPRERFAFYAVPYDVSDISGLRLEASDEVGNRAETGFVDRFFPRPLGTDSIGLSDGFLQRVVPAIQSQTPSLEKTADLLQGYLTINGELRRRNRAELREMAKRSRPEFLWRGAFLPHRNAKSMAGFAERRTYLYNGRAVDTQDHLGFDLASTARSPVQAAAAGQVLRAGWFGIYGNAVVLDHGYGLMTLYGHLSTVSVEEGQAVERGQEIARTGATGLAGGDHLHFAVLLQGLPVNPREWWDDHWIDDRLRLKLGDALP